MPHHGATVRVVEHAQGVKLGCKVCRTQLAEGKFAVGLEVDDQKYFVGENPPRRCCNEEKAIPLLFAELDDVEHAVQETLRTIARDGTTANLKLLQVAEFPADGTMQ